METVAATLIAAPRRAVWDVVADPARVPEFVDGLTGWEPDGPIAAGLGARFRLHVRLGGIELGELIEIVESDPPADLAWRSVRGVDLRLRWRLREPAPGRTRVELRLAYHVAGGLTGLLAMWVAAPLVRAQLERTLAALRARAETPAVVPRLAVVPTPA